MNKTLILVRGVPGSGKTTFAEYIAKYNDAVVCTADDFFINEKGEYKFNADRLGFAHHQCMVKCENAMKEGKPVIVGNTSTTEKEVNPYMVMAEKYDYFVFSVIVENRHGGVNSHGVPDEKIVIMRNRFSVKL